MLAREAARGTRYRLAALVAQGKSNREIADQLSRKNEIEIEREGMRYTVKVPNEVTFSYEVELGDDSSEIEIEIKW